MGIQRTIQNLFKSEYPRYRITSSDEFRYTWFRVAKAGTRTILHVLQEHTHPDVHGGRVEFNPKEHRDKFKFAFIRNPWTRLKSCYINKVIHKRLFEPCWDREFDYFVDYVADQDLKSANIHIRLQTELFPHHGLDHLARFERFGEEFDFIMNQKLKLNIPLIHHNKSSVKSEEIEYSARSIQKVADVYDQDIKFGNYQYSI